MSQSSANYLCFPINKILKVLARLKKTKIRDAMPLLTLESRDLLYHTVKTYHILMIIVELLIFFLAQGISSLKRHHPQNRLMLK